MRSVVLRGRARDSLRQRRIHVGPLPCRKCGESLKSWPTFTTQSRQAASSTRSFRPLCGLRTPAMKPRRGRLGLSEPEDERPPPPDVRYVPVGDEDREIATIS